MEVFEKKDKLRTRLQNLKNQGKTIGFVPTMGALHDGHLSLIRQSLQQTDITVVSIFVNPTQFNNAEDLEKYPRTLEKDKKLLTKEGVDILFAPDEKEMYPEPDNRIFDFGNLDKVMEGKFRPGHFNGVAQIVSKLFEIVEPDKAFFGQKDFQQLAIIKRLVRDYMSDLKIEIVACPIVREPDGLAMSSRNVRLSPEQRKSAAKISETLFEALRLAKNMSPDELKKWVTDKVNEDENLEVEYFEIVDNVNLMPIKSWSDANEKTGCIAVNVGNVRLIDNITFKQ